MALGNTGRGWSHPAETAPDNGMELFGQILQEPNRVWEIMPSQAGIVESIEAKPNELVSKDMPLARIRPKAGGPPYEIKSPGHGIVLTRYARKNESVDTVTSLMTLAGIDVLKASFDVYERDIPRVSLGQTLFIKAMAFPGLKFKGKIIFISPQVDEETRTLKVQALIYNKERKLRFGMLITAYTGFQETPEQDSRKEKPDGVILAPADAANPIEIPDHGSIVETLKVSRRTFKVYVKVLGEVVPDPPKSRAKKQCRFDLFEADLPRVHEGQAIRVHAAARSGKAFDGRITFLSPRIDENTRSIKLLTEISDPEAELTPGMSLAGDIEISSREVYAVPLTAVQTLDGKPAVFAARDGRHFFARKVKLGEHSEGMAEVIEGLNEGDVAVSHGGLLLKQAYLNQTEDSK